MHKYTKAYFIPWNSKKCSAEVSSIIVEKSAKKNAQWVMTKWKRLLAASSVAKNELGMKRTKMNEKTIVYLSAKVNPYQYNRYTCDMSRRSSGLTDSVRHKQQPTSLIRMHYLCGCVFAKNRQKYAEKMKIERRMPKEGTVQYFREIKSPFGTCFCVCVPVQGSLFYLFLFSRLTHVHHSTVNENTQLFIHCI